MRSALKRLTAIYRIERTAPIKHMVREEYETKKELQQDLRRNGYRVIAILDEKQVEAVKHKERFSLTDYEDYVRQVIHNH